jgi:hypothetical protein
MDSRWSYSFLPFAKLFLHDLCIWTLDLLEYLQCRFSQFDALCSLVELVQIETHIEKSVSFTPPVPDHGDLERQLIILDGFARLAQGGVGTAQVA